MRLIDRLEQLSNALMCYVAAPLFAFLVVKVVAEFIGVFF